MSSIISIYGGNTFLTSRRLAELTRDFAQNHGWLAVEKIDADEAEPQAVLEAVQSPAFLSPKKLVVIKNLGQSKQAAELLEQIIYSTGDGTDVILYETSTDKRSVFFKQLKKNTQAEEYEQPDSHGLSKWLVAEAQNLGAVLVPSDAFYLIERTGADQQKLANELEKLAAYSPAIGRQEIDLLVVRTPQSKVFDLLDAAFGGDKRKALRLYEEQRAQKVEPQAILAMLAWQLQLITLAHLAGGRSAEQIANDAAMSPFPVKRAQALAKRIEAARLREMTAEALKIDVMSKRSPIDIDEALRHYISSL